MKCTFHGRFYVFSRIKASTLKYDEQNTTNHTTQKIGQGRYAGLNMKSEIKVAHYPGLCGIDTDQLLF